jgi:hypothetical protein
MQRNTVRTNAVIWGLALAAVCALAAPAGAAPAADDQQTTETEAPRPGAADALTQVLPGTIGASVGKQTVVASAWGGYDAAMKAPVFSVNTEVKVMSRLVLMAGGAYAAPNALGQGGGDLRPQLGARLQLLDQARYGLDVGVGFLFREDRFGAEDGLFQGALSVGRRFGRTAAVMNVIYGQDGEGDDHEGELHLAVLTDVGQRFHVGLDGRATHSLASTDPRRAQLGTPSGDVFGGPLAAFTYGPIAVLAEAGVSEIWTTHAQGGVVTMGGVAATF